MKDPVFFTFLLLSSFSLFFSLLGVSSFTFRTVSSILDWSTSSHPLAQASESTSISPSHGPPYQVREDPGGPFLSLYSGGAALEGGAAHPVGRWASVGLEFLCGGVSGQVWIFPQPPQGPGLQAPGHFPSSHSLGCRYWQAQPLTQLVEGLIPLKNLG